MLNSRTAFVIAFRFLTTRWLFNKDTAYAICSVQSVEELEDVLDHGAKYVTDIRMLFVFANWMAGFSGFDLINRKIKKEKAS